MRQHEGGATSCTRPWFRELPKGDVSDSLLPRDHAEAIALFTHRGCRSQSQRPRARFDVVDACASASDIDVVACIAANSLSSLLDRMLYPEVAKTL